MMFTILEDVFLHAGGSYMGYKFCGNVEGGEDAAGQQVTVEGHTAKLYPGKCSPHMMQGYPYMQQKPRDFKTSPGGLTVHWDGKGQRIMDVADIERCMDPQDLGQFLLVKKHVKVHPMEIYLHP